MSNVYVVIFVTPNEGVSCELITKSEKKANKLVEKLTNEELGCYAYVDYYRGNKKRIENESC